MADNFLDFNGLSRYTSKIIERFKLFVPTSRTINNKPLSGDITLTASDIGISSVDTSGFVPNTRRVNNKPLSSDITLNYSDVGAQVSGSYATTSQLSAYVPTTRKINNKALSGDITLTASDLSISIPDMSNVVLSNSTGIAIGLDANINNSAVHIGQNAKGQVNSAVIGPNAFAGALGVAIGNNAYAIQYGIAIGGNAYDASWGVCIGYNSVNKSSPNSILIGSDITIAQAKNNSISIGHAVSQSGDNSIGIGQGVTVSANNSIALGARSAVAQKNTIQLGDDGISSLNCKVQPSTGSDQRDKTDIAPIKDGAIEFLKRIQAICYRYNGRGLYIPDRESLSGKDKDDFYTYGLCSYDKEAHARGDKKGERMRVGVLAQEVQAALEEVYGSSDYANIVNDNFHDLETKPDDVENQLTIAYSNFIPFLIKAIQEQQQQIDELKIENDFIKRHLSLN